MLFETLAEIASACAKVSSVQQVLFANIDEARHLDAPRRRERRRRLSALESFAKGRRAVQDVEWAV
jgi:hypothetical protein